METKKIFISYKHYNEKLNNIDEKVARILYDKLKSAGFECWMDKMNMPVVTESWINNIVTAIEKCDLVVMVVSKFSQESKTIRLKELSVIADNNKPIIPFRIDKSKLLPEFQWEMSRIQWVEAWDDYENKIEELISKMRLQLGDPKDPTPKVQKQVDVSPVINNSSEERIAGIKNNALLNSNTNKNTQSLRIEMFMVDGVKFRMIYVKGGEFMMGANEQDYESRDNEKPAHKVILSDYWIGETQVTQELWQAVMGNNPSCFKGEKLPIEQVSWNDCQLFISKLNELTGQHFCLPTEAQWEYAARGGHLGKANDYKYSGSQKIADVAWYVRNSSLKTHQIATKKSNELGLFDMSGNVCEWCQDGYMRYKKNMQKNPTGREDIGSIFHVYRGGSWHQAASNCRITSRSCSSPLVSYNYIGLRLAL